jgi:hypothetical protein
VHLLLKHIKETQTGIVDEGSLHLQEMRRKTKYGARYSQLGQVSSPDQVTHTGHAQSEIKHAAEIPAEKPGGNK